MIIECPACQARFRLDEAKIKGKGARVRCRRCGESILVLKSAGTQAPPGVEAASGTLDLSKAVRTSVDERPRTVPPAQADLPKEEPFAAAGIHEPEGAAADVIPPSPHTPAFDDLQSGHSDLFAAPSSAKDEVDAAFDIFLASDPAEGHIAPEPEKEATPVPDEPTFEFRPDEKLDFSPGTQGDADSGPAAGEEQDLFVAPEGNPLQETVAAEPQMSDLLIGNEDSPVFFKEEPEKEPSPDYYDISTTLRKEPPASGEPEEIRAAPPSMDFLTRDMEPPPAASGEEAPPAAPEVEEPGPREPVRPRTQEIRKASFVSLRPSLVALVLLFVALAGGGAYLGFTKSGQDSLRSLVPGMESLWLQGKGKPGPQYDVRNLIGYYEPGTKAGNLFIIKGQVTNVGRSRKSGVRVHAALLDANDKPVAEKTCYAGNVLSGETLRSADRGKIEEAQSNRFGDRLVNMDVAPGKSVQFMVVFFNAPEGVDAYRLEAKDGD